MKLSVLSALLLSSQAIDITSLKHHHNSHTQLFSDSPNQLDHVSLQDGNSIGSIQAFREEQEMNKVNAKKKAEKEASA